MNRPILTVAVSGRSIFHMEDANRIFEAGTQADYDRYMLETQDEPLQPGAAFALVQKLLRLNTTRFPEPHDRVEVVLLSRNSASAGVRIMNSLRHHGLEINRAVFTNGGDRFNYLEALGADLFLCANEEEARNAITRGVAAASIIPREHQPGAKDQTLRIAFDGDSVLFSDEADQVYRAGGLQQFSDSEDRHADTPLGDGPLRRFFEKLCQLQADLPPSPSLLETALVTARNRKNHERPMTTLQSWGLAVNVGIFNDGRPKGPLLRAYGADIFFDDTGKNIMSAVEHNVASGRVHFGGGGIQSA